MSDTALQNPIDYAMAYLAGGISIIPIQRDGSKSPEWHFLPKVWDDHTAKFRASWKPFQSEFVSVEEAKTWWGRPHPPGLAAVCGAISGCLELLDFDLDAARVFAAWQDEVDNQKPGLLDRLTVIRTPRGGFHVWFRTYETVVPGNAKLASRIIKGEDGRETSETLIETRGEGGYALLPGCPPECHSTRKIYEHLMGPPLWDMENIHPEDREILISCARYFDQTPAKEQKFSPDLKPGEDFDLRGPPWSEILVPHGWRLVATRDSEMRWCRPGKDGRCWSATTGRCSSGGADLLKVFSSNAHPFAPGVYGKFRAVALLHHQGNLQETARALARMGFGSRSSPAPAERTNVSNEHSDTSGKQGESQGKPALEFPAPIPASQLRAVDAVHRWLWKGFLSRGEITLFSALWKSGKTTMLAHLLQAFAQGGEFLGFRVEPAKVLYITEEPEHRWAERRDRLGIQDHVDFLIRPFPAQSTASQWEALIGYTNRLVNEKAYDMIFMDTLSNLWPVKDENNAAMVQGSLMPLHSLYTDASLCLVHHTRKSDGPEATASRGSGALTAFVDTIIEFRRMMPGDRKDRRRVLTGYGKDDLTPSELVIELTDQGYTTCGDREEIHRLETAAVIASILPSDPPGMTANEILDAWPDPTKPRRQTFQAALREGSESGRWHRDGKGGTRHDPFRYWGEREAFEEG